MAEFQYEALDRKAKEIVGTQEADDIQDLNKKLQAKGLYLKNVIGGRKSQLFGRKKTSLIELAIGTRHLAILLQSGFPLSEALSFLIVQFKEKRLGEIIAQVRERVKAGMSFNQALRLYPEEFNALYVNMIYAGETAGSLDIVLFRLADFIEKQVELRNRLQLILTYPLIMLFVGGAILSFLLIYVVPIVSQIFIHMDQSLPLPTIILIAVSSFLKNFWMIILAGAVMMIILLRAYAKAPKGRFFLDGLKLNIPVFSGFFLKATIVNFSRTLATLIIGGVEIPKALDIVKDITDNKVISGAIKDLNYAISRGEGFAVSLEKSKIFPPMFIRMIGAGEKSGQLQNILEKAAQIYENELNISINRLVAFLEPAIILVMGIIVGGIVLAILLPIFEMSQFVG